MCKESYFFVLLSLIEIETKKTKLSFNLGFFWKFALIWW